MDVFHTKKQNNLLPANRTDDHRRSALIRVQPNEQLHRLTTNSRGGVAASHCGAFKRRHTVAIAAEYEGLAVGQRHRTSVAQFLGDYLGVFDVSNIPVVN